MSTSSSSSRSSSPQPPRWLFTMDDSGIPVPRYDVAFLNTLNIGTLRQIAELWDIMAYNQTRGDIANDIVNHDNNHVDWRRPNEIAERDNYISVAQRVPQHHSASVASRHRQQHVQAGDESFADQQQSTGLCISHHLNGCKCRWLLLQNGRWTCTTTASSPMRSNTTSSAIHSQSDSHITHACGGARQVQRSKFSDPVPLYRTCEFRVNLETP